MSKNLLIILCIFSLCIITSCKTSEKNYKTAYEIAKAKQETDIDPDIAQRIEDEKHGNVTEINGDSIRIKTEYLTIVEDTLTNIPKYGVAVGNFKQIFNARMFKKRLIGKQFPAYILKDKFGELYVVAKGFEELNNAVICAKSIRQNIGFPLPIEPFIICKAY